MVPTNNESNWQSVNCIRTYQIYYWYTTITNIQDIEYIRYRYKKYKVNKIKIEIINETKTLTIFTDLKIQGKLNLSYFFPLFFLKKKKRTKLRTFFFLPYFEEMRTINEKGSGIIWNHTRHF